LARASGVIFETTSHRTPPLHCDRSPSPPLPKVPFTTACALVSVFLFVVLRMEPRASHLLVTGAIIEPHPKPFISDQANQPTWPDSPVTSLSLMPLHIPIYLSSSPLKPPNISRTTLFATSSLNHPQAGWLGWKPGTPPPFSPGCWLTSLYPECLARQWQW
jgi:hypothetical protein